MGYVPFHTEQDLALQPSLFPVFPRLGDMPTHFEDSTLGIIEINAVWKTGAKEFDPVEIMAFSDFKKVLKLWKYVQK